ncbi:MAG: Ig-like domain-containing protein [Pseudomonadota bacterium]
MKDFRSKARLLFPCIFVAMVSCTESDGNGSSTSTETISLSLSMTRIEEVGLDPVSVTVTLQRGGTALSGESLSLSASKGTLSSVVDNGDGTYSFTITPDDTGVYPVTVSYEGESITREAVVLQEVASGWGQPMSVPGYANTDGYEDGITITPDGEYLFVQTGPYYFSGFFVYDEPRTTGGCEGARLTPSRCTHPYIDNTIGTRTAPERPNFPDGRFSGTTNLHNANSFQVGEDLAPNFAVSTVFYGLKKQADGTFKEPFKVAFEDLNDGIVSPFGLSFRKNSDGTYTAIFALKDVDTTDQGFDIYTHTFAFGSDVNLGDYRLDGTPGNAPLRDTFYPSTHVDLTDNSGTQGNPNLYYESDGVIKSIWVDDEFDGDSDTKMLSVHELTSGTFPGGTWTKTVLPSAVNVASTEAIQPTFVGDGLFFTQDTSIAYCSYSGSHSSSDFADNSNWSSPSIILQKDTTVTSLKPPVSDIGKIIAIGEPTIATVDGKTVLYFVYGYIRSIDSITGIADLDLQAGFVEKD